MRSERLALYTTWYPGVEPFLPAWSSSVHAQTDRDFDVWIGVDGLDPDRLAAQAPVPSGASWIVGPPGASPSEVRQRAIALLIDEYDGLVFVDSDDWLLPDRIESARGALRRHDVTACALRIVDGQGRDLGLVFGPTGLVDWSAFLSRYNAFGLSNAAYRTEVLRRIPPAPAGCIAFDWHLVTHAWCARASLHFDDTPRMAYRQYGANVARVLRPFAAADIERAASVVLAHHRLVRGLAAARPEFQPLLEAARERVERFCERIVARPDRLEQYVAALNRIEPQYVWWWCVAHPQLEQQWTN
jgi:hypothetical protein